MRGPKNGWVFVMAFIPACVIGSHFDSRTSVGDRTDRLGKLLPIFQVVRFPNDPCVVSGGTKNGTCYTAEECSNIGGTDGGSCASGFGVCCIVTLTCGSSSNQNCTYFEVSSPSAGQCRAEICKFNNDVCSIRLDFTSFTITGPNTITTSSVELLNGQEVPNAATGVAYAQTGRCLTDRFTVSNQRNLPVICGVNTGYHVYFEASTSCNSLDFELGSQLVGVTAFATRTWNIKVTQISCTDTNLPPPGCDQFLTGIEGFFETFNYASDRRHLAEQHQQICFRREQGYCSICFSADSADDISIGGFKNAAASKKGEVAGSICCAHGAAGIGGGSNGAYDCIMIPGAQDAAGAAKPDSQCANGVGLITAMAANTAAGKKTVCSKSFPFRVEFFSDAYEMSLVTTGEATSGTNFQTGFKLRYFQITC